MAVEIENVTSAEQQQVRDAIEEALRRIRTAIPSIEMENCIRKRARGNGKIVNGGAECEEDPNCLGYHGWYGLGPFKVKSDDIHVCLGNIRRLGTDLSATIAHEWAHSCCWPEGGGGGVPSGGHW